MATPDVKLKHKVQLREKKSEEPEVTVTPEPKKAEPKKADAPKAEAVAAAAGGSKSYKWIWIILGLIVAGAICFFLLRGNENKTDTTNGEEAPVLVNDSTEQTIDSVAGQAEELTGQNEEATSGEDIQTVTEGEVSETAPVNATTTVSDNVETEAMNVIRGDYGNGQERKDKLGSRYEKIQSRVNALKREGKF